MELALQDEGVVPTVISTADAVKGAVPLAHQRCLVLKVHGDYLDDRIKNTEEELSSYDAAVDSYLDRIFDEFGLIICGWSGDWDPALRAAIDRSPSRRYATYWAMRGQPSTHADGLINRRGATAIAIDSADRFFGDLEGKIRSLEELSAPSTLSVAAAVAAVKRYASDPQHRIRLNDLLVAEATDLSKKSLELPVNRLPNYEEAMQQRFVAYDALTQTMREALYTASFWAESYHHDIV
jgi:hypothetical protein